MKKGIKYLWLLLIMLMVSGCTVVRIDTSNIDTIIGVVLSKENTLYNQVGRGYKYYIPRGVNYIDTVDFNEKLYSNGIYYYLYIDAVSYYNEVEPVYNEKKDAYYSREFTFNDKNGYLEITKTDNDKYLVNFVYNYAKIEAVVDKEEINDVILNSSYILSTVKFNNNVIKLMLNEEYFTNNEEEYNVFDKKGESNNFLEYIDDNDNLEDSVEESQDSNSENNSEASGEQDNNSNESVE